MKQGTPYRVGFVWLAVVFLHGQQMKELVLPAGEAEVRIPLCWVGVVVVVVVFVASLRRRGGLVVLNLMGNRNHERIFSP